MRKINAHYWKAARGQNRGRAYVRVFVGRCGASHQRADPDRRVRWTAQLRERVGNGRHRWRSELSSGAVKQKQKKACLWTICADGLIFVKVCITISTGIKHISVERNNKTEGQKLHLEVITCSCSWSPAAGIVVRRERQTGTNSSWDSTSPLLCVRSRAQSH